MLQNIRDKTQGWITWVIVIVICVTFALWGINNYQSSGATEESVAEVNGMIITQKDLLTTYRNNLANMEQQQGKSFQLTDQLDASLKQQALEQLINYQVALQGAVAEKFHITNNEIFQVIAQIPVFQENGQFSQQRFVQALRAMNDSEQQYLERVKAAMLIEQARQGISGSSFVLPQELNHLISLLEQKRDIDYVIVPLSHFKDIIVNEADVQKYYDANKENLKTAEKVSLSYIQLTKEQVAKDLNLPVTDPQVEKEFVNKSEALINVSYEEPESLEPAAKATGLSIQETGQFTKNTKKPGLTSHPGVVAAAFSDNVINNGYNSDVITLDNGDLIVIRLNKYTPQKIKTLEQAKPQIEKILEVKLKEDQAKILSQQIVSQLKKNENKQEIASVNDLKWLQKENITRQDAELDPTMVKYVFQLPVPATKDSPTIASFKLPSNDYMVIRLTAVIPGNVENVPKEKIESYTQQLTTANGQFDYDLYISSLRNRAKIEESNQK